MKTTWMNKSFSAVLFFAVLGCVSSPTAKQAGTEFKLKTIEEKSLDNGLRVIFIKDTALPRIGYTLFFPAGSAKDPVGQEGLAAMTVSLLDQGTTKKSALQIADDFAQLGSSFNEGASQDYTMVSTSGLSKYQRDLLNMFSDVVINPSFANAEIERKRSQVLAELAQAQDNPGGYADLLLEQENYQEHPYSHPISGKIESVKKIGRAQILAQYQNYYRPNNAWLAVYGNYDAQLVEQVEKVFGSWKRHPMDKENLHAIPKDGEKSIKLFSKSGLQQTQIRMGQIGIARNNPDFLKLRLANIVLGGAFASRLNQRVRDDLGLTYSISSSSETRRETGSFEISTFTRNDKAGETIKNTFSVVEEFRKNGINQKELDAAKALLIGQFPAAIETVDRLAFNLLILRMNNISDSYLTQFFSNVNGITLSEVNAVIKTYVRPENFKTVVYADAAQVQEQLRALEQIAGPLKIEQVK